MLIIVFQFIPLSVVYSIFTCSTEELIQLIPETPPPRRFSPPFGDFIVIYVGIFIEKFPLVIAKIESVETSVNFNLQVFETKLGMFAHLNCPVSAGVVAETVFQFNPLSVDNSILSA